MITEQWKGICVNLKEGNNKWWKAELHDDGTVITKWGKIVQGAEQQGQTKVFSGAGKDFICGKFRKNKTSLNLTKSCQT